MILVIDILVLDYGIKMPKINLTQKIIDNFLNHAQNEYPYECCGFILGRFKDDESIALQYISVENTKEENRERRFLIDPIAYQEAEDEADRQKLSIISIVHSHPDHPDKPSDFDRDHAWPGFSYIIISVKNGKSTTYRSWQLDQNRSTFIEEKINVINEDNINGK